MKCWATGSDGDPTCVICEQGSDPTGAGVIRPLLCAHCGVLVHDADMCRSVTLISEPVYALCNRSQQAEARRDKAAIEAKSQKANVALLESAAESEQEGSDADRALVVGAAVCRRQGSCVGWGCIRRRCCKRASTHWQW